MWYPTGLIPLFSKTEGNTYATLLHHPLLFGEIQRSAQEVALIWSPFGAPERGIRRHRHHQPILAGGGACYLLSTALVFP